METEKLKELIEKCKEGDAAAMEELLCIAYGPVFYQCQRLLKNNQDAQDVTQEILLTVYTKLGNLKEPAAFWGWLKRITSTRCMNAITRVPKDLQIIEDEEGHSILDRLENEDVQQIPEEALDNAETARMIGEIVDALPDEQRICTLLYYYDEFSVKEIAGMTGVSENTVKSRLNYARKAIKERVLEYEKKGTKLYGLSPLPFLLYFLQKTAEENADSAAAAKAAAEVMAKGAVPGASGAVLQAAKTTGEDVGTATTAGAAVPHVLGGLSLKAVAVIIAGIVAIGGVGAAIYAAATHNSESSGEAVSAMTEELETEETENEEAPEEDTETEPQDDTKTEKLLLGAEYLSQLPYTGDIAKCAMTTEQAEAFAQIIDDCILESQNLSMWDGVTWFCRAALFDAGDGIPALMIAGGIDMCYTVERESGYIPDFSRIYCWDGTQAVLVVEDTANFILTEDGFLLDYFGAEGSSYYVPYTELYSLSGGMLSSEPVHVYEQFAFDESGAPTLKMLEERIAQEGHFRGTYDYSTLGVDTWLHHDGMEIGGVLYEEPGWVAACLDGKFLSVQEAAEEGNMLIWGAVDWILGHGSAGSRDVSHYWYGNWSDAQDVADLLHGNTAEEEASGSYEELTESIISSGYPRVSILHTALNTQEEKLEVYYEIPVFEGQEKGYDIINAFFRKLNDEFWGPENESLAWMKETVSEYPPSDTYRDTVTASIYDWTDQYVSVSLSYSWYMGGAKDFGKTNYNFRTDTGEELLLSDILDGSDTEIKDMILDAMVQTYGDIDTYFPGAAETIQNYSIEDFDFYISDGYIHVCFDKYEIAYGVAGELEVELPITL